MLSFNSTHMARLAVASALLVTLVTTSACGYRPLYGQSSATPMVERYLATINVKPIPDRSGQLMRSALEKRLEPAKLNLAKDYNLSVQLRESISSLAVERSAFATRSNLSLNAEFTLRKASDGQVMLSGKAKTVASYNILSSDFATLAAQRDARERAIENLSDTLRTRLAIYFHGPAQTPQQATPSGTYR